MQWHESLVVEENLLGKHEIKNMNENMTASTHMENLEQSLDKRKGVKCEVPEKTMDTCCPTKKL